ncbi:MAG: HD domain-containing protein, partial [Armatimonadetes bacterium]|nr:HD domain-containing protein [Armatimonadota bacterium]
LDLFRVVQMVLIHDIVEIDAGDAYAYAPGGPGDQAEREARAADRLFGLLPQDQGRRFRELWEEFEARQTPEARFAAALDRMQPLLNNLLTGGLMWKKHGVTRGQVLERCRPIGDGSRRLWAEMEVRIREAVREEQLGAEDPPPGNDS